MTIKYWIFMLAFGLCASMSALGQQRWQQDVNSFPYLETKTFIAYIADNSALGIHKKGYNGVASLIPRHSGNNIFVPTTSGLNYERITLSGLGRYGPPNSGQKKFEPRNEPMFIEYTDKKRVILVQPETSHSHVSARIIFTVEEPYYLHQHIELTFHKKFCDPNEKNRFESLWASYIHMPPDLHIYLKAGNDSNELEGWYGLTLQDHSSHQYQIRRLPDNSEINAQEHLAVMKTESPMTEIQLKQSGWKGNYLPRDVNGPLNFYYGFCHDSLMFLMMFKQPQNVRLAYSPCGAGKEPGWNPAWDYILHLDDVKIDKKYEWDVCVAIKPYQGRSDVLKEVKRYEKIKLSY